MNEHIVLSVGCNDVSVFFRFIADPFDTARNQTVSFYSDTNIDIQSPVPVPIKYSYSFENQTAKHGINFNAYILGLGFQKTFTSENELLKNVASLLDNFAIPLYVLFGGSYDIKRREDDSVIIYKYTDEENKSLIYSKIINGEFKCSTLKTM